MTDTNEKLRSLFLAALMVFSVFAGTVAFSGGAVAATANEDPTLETATEYSGNVELAWNTDVEVQDDDSGSYSTLDENSLENTNITVEVGGNELDASEYDISQDGSAPTSDATYTLTLPNDVNPNQDVTVTFNGTFRSVSFPSATTVYDEEEVEVDVTSADVVHTDGNNEDDASDGLDASNAKSVYVGEVLNVDADDSYGDTVEIKRVGGSTVLDGALSDNGQHIAFDTSNLDTGATYRVQFDGDSTVDTFNVSALNLEAEAQDTELTTEDSIEVDVDAIRGSAPVTAYLQEGDGDYVQNQTATLSGQGSTTLDFGSQDEGNYTVTVVDNRTAQSVTTDQINVSSAADDEASFAQSVYTEQSGDVANVTVQLTGTDEATVEIGNANEDNYQLIAHVTDDSGDGEVVLQLNTFTAGASSAATVITPGDDDDSVSLASESGFTQDDDDDGTVQNSEIGSNLLDATDYEMNVTAGHSSDVKDEDDVATLSVSERTSDSVQVWRAPESDFENLNEGDDAGKSDVYGLIEEGNLTQGNTVAFRDTMVAQVQASGLEGALAYAQNDLSAANETEAYDTLIGAGSPAIKFEVENEDPGANTATSAELFTGLSNENRSVIYDEANDTHFVTVDTGHFLDSSANGQFEDGDSMKANFTVFEGNSDLTDDTEVINDTLTVEDRDATLNGDNDITVQAASGQAISGETNLAPGSEVTVRIRSTTQNSPFLLQPNAVVQADGTFTAMADFSERSPGANFTAQTRLSGSNIGDSIDGTVGAAPTASVGISDQESNGDTVVVDSATLSEGGFIAIHNGSASGDVIGSSSYLEAGSHEDVEVTLNTTQDEAFTAVAMPHLDTDGDQTYGFDGGSVDGPYTSNGSAVTDSANVTIVSGEETTTEQTTEETTTEETTEETTTEEATTMETTTEETTTGDSGPGFTAVIALVALVAAALLAVRRDN